jgi:mono/diheme cytochrome c family protein
MARQPKYHWPDQPSDFFDDGTVNRPLVEGTIARGQLRLDARRYTGQQTAVGEPAPAEPEYATEFPAPVTEAMMRRGRERYNIFCAVCHGRTGEGNGKVVQRGYAKPPSYHTEKLRTMPVGKYFDVITRGFGAMPDYAEQFPVDDRWAIIAFIRALQFSRNVPAAELTPQDKTALEQAKPPPQPAEGGERGR